MANNTTTTWRWSGRTNGDWEGVNWADAYGVDVDDYPDRAKCLLPGATVVAQYGPRLFELAREDAWQYLRRLMAGDLDVVAELDGKLSDDQ